MKIVLVGAGSFVFGPSVLSQTILENDLGAFELALVDVDPEIGPAIAAVGRRMAAALGKPVTLSSHTDWNTALPGADYVVCCVAVQGQRRFEMDWNIIDQYSPDHIPSEFGGIAGISYSLRQMAMILALTDSMRQHCPQAWLLDVSNPLPRVCQAAHENGIHTVGFCSMSVFAHRLLWQLWGGQALDYPFSPAHERWDILTAGCNHFAWVLKMEERAGGRDVCSEIPERIAAGATSGNPQIEQLCRDTGYLLSGGDNHVRDFLEPSPFTDRTREAFHGSAIERRERLQLLRAVAAGETSWDALPLGNSWERPGDFIAARQKPEPAYFPALNLVNRGQMAGLPLGIFVETPCTVSAAGVEPATIALPNALLPLTLRTAEVTQAIVKAATDHRKEVVYRAIDLDPTIVDKVTGKQAINACLAAHADLLPVYA